MEMRGVTRQIKKDYKILGRWTEKESRISCLSDDWNARRKR